MKEKYEAPEVMELGEVEDLTLGKTWGAELDFRNGFFPIPDP